MKKFNLFTVLLIFQVIHADHCEHNIEIQKTCDCYLPKTESWPRADSKKCAVKDYCLDMRGFENNKEKWGCYQMPLCGVHTHYHMHTPAPEDGCYCGSKDPIFDKGQLCNGSACFEKCPAVNLKAPAPCLCDVKICDAGQYCWDQLDVSCHANAKCNILEQYPSQKEDCKCEYETCDPSTPSQKFCFEGKCYGKPRCFKNGFVTITEACFCGPSDEVTCDAGEFCHGYECNPLPKCKKSKLNPVDRECICREEKDICSPKQYCYYGADECQDTNEADFTGKEDYGKHEHEGIEFPGDRIKNYYDETYQAPRIFGYNFMKPYPGELLQADAIYMFDERQMFKLTCPENVLDGERTIFDCATPSQGPIQPYKNYIYILSPENELYVYFTEFEPTRLHVKHHSFFMNGGPVLVAGHFETLKDGINILWSNGSGHYQPCFKCLKKIMEYFKKHGITTDVWECLDEYDDTNVYCRDIDIDSDERNLGIDDTYFHKIETIENSYSLNFFQIPIWFIEWIVLCLFLYFLGKIFKVFLAPRPHHNIEVKIKAKKDVSNNVQNEETKDVSDNVQNEQSE